MADRVETFEQLESWAIARELMRLIYATFRRPLPSKDFGLRDHVQRAAMSAMTNIAEGFERLHTAEKLQFYSIARASRGEVRSLDYVMLDAGYITADEHQQLLSLVARTGRLVSGLIRSTRNRIAVA